MMGTDTRDLEAILGLTWAHPPYPRAKGDQMWPPCLSVRQRQCTVIGSDQLSGWSLSLCPTHTSRTF